MNGSISLVIEVLFLGFVGLGNVFLSMFDVDFILIFEILVIKDKERDNIVGLLLVKIVFNVWLDIGYVFEGWEEGFVGLWIELEVEIVGCVNCDGVVFEYWYRIVFEWK